MAVPDTLKFDAEEPLFCDLRNRGIAPGNSAKRGTCIALRTAKSESRRSNDR